MSSSEQDHSKSVSCSIHPIASSPLRTGAADRIRNLEVRGIDTQRLTLHTNGDWIRLLAFGAASSAKDATTRSSSLTVVSRSLQIHEGNSEESPMFPTGWLGDHECPTTRSSLIVYWKGSMLLISYHSCFSVFEFIASDGGQEH
jgi:hypothetical protein